MTKSVVIKSLLTAGASLVGHAGFNAALRILPVLVLLGTLAACDGHRIVSRDFDVAYSPAEVSGGAGDRLWVEVLGTPREDWDAAALSAAVIDTFSRGGASWLNTTYTAAAADAHNPDYRLRVLFNPALGFPTATACGKAVAEGGRQEARGEVFMALCRDERALSYGWGFLGPLGSLEAERESLDRFLLIMAMVIMPDENPLLNGSCSTSSTC